MGHYVGMEIAVSGLLAEDLQSREGAFWGWEKNGVKCMEDISGDG